MDARLVCFESKDSPLRKSPDFGAGFGGCRDRAGKR